MQNHDILFPVFFWTTTSVQHPLG